MKKSIYILLTLLLLLPIQSRMFGVRMSMVERAIAAIDDDDDFDKPVREEQTLQQTYPLAASGTRSVNIDNVFGSIEVVGTNSDQVQVVIKKTIRAEDKAALERAKKEVVLTPTNNEAGLKLYVDGPFRCHHDNDSSCCCHDHAGYVVKMDF